TNWVNGPDDSKWAQYGLGQGPARRRGKSREPSPFDPSNGRRPPLVSFLSSRRRRRRRTSPAAVCSAPEIRPGGAIGKQTLGILYCLSLSLSLRRTCSVLRFPRLWLVGGLDRHGFDDDDDAEAGVRGGGACAAELRGRVQLRPRQVPRRPRRPPRLHRPEESEEIFPG
uniref:Uncharacterized protein n=1 Tax=Oryza rufipogon TaxID=4529 RepID=A0A0E0MTA4_ORYRU